MCVSDGRVIAGDAQPRTNVSCSTTRRLVEWSRKVARDEIAPIMG